MFRFISLSLTSLALAFFSVPVSAYDAATVPVVVVTPTRSPVPLNQIASSMTVITAEEIERKRKATVVELLREVPGLSIANNGGIGQPTRAFVRGANSNHVLVMMDGIVVNDPSDPGSAFDFSNLTTDNIERIEILRGPQSTLYGSQAIGGVINIISRKGQGAPRHTAFAQYGHYNTSRLGAGSSGEIGNTSYSLQSSFGRTSGFSSFAERFGGRERDGNATYTLAGNIENKLTDLFTAKLNVRYNRTDTDFDSPGGFTRPNDDPFPSNDSRQFNGRAAGELSLLGGKWKQELGFSYLHLNRAQITEFFDSLFNVYFGRNQYTGWRETVDWIHRVNLIPSHRLTIGAEASSDHYKLDSIPAVALSEVNVDNRAVFIDDHFTVLPNLHVNGSARIDDHQSFGRQFTWKVAPGYLVEPTGTRLKFTYGTGFKAPSLAQLYDPATGNAGLMPEKSKGWDAGFEQTLSGGRVTFGSTYFFNNIENLIGFSNAPPFPTINVGKARTRGVENTLTVRPTVDLTLSAAYSYIQADDQLNDKRLARRPRHLATASAQYQYSAEGDVGIDLRHVGNADDIDFAAPFGRVTVKRFTTVDIHTNYRLNRNATLYGRVDNLLDKRYEEVYGYGQPGLSLMGGIKVGF